MRAFRKLIKFARKPPREKLRAAWATIRRHLMERDKVRVQAMLESALAAPTAIQRKSAFYVTYRPDSDFNFGAHPEIAALSEKWTHNNLLPNAGDLPRLYAILLNIKQVIHDNVAGDFAELGVYHGNSAAVFAHYARLHGRALYLFDTFTGFDARDLKGFDQKISSEFADTSLQAVKELVGTEGATYCKGYFPESIPAALAERAFCIVHLDCDLYEPTKAALEFFFPRLSPGGLLIIHDYSSGYWEGLTRAVDEFVATVPENLVLLPDKSGTAMIRKSARN